MCPGWLIFILDSFAKSKTKKMKLDFSYLFRYLPYPKRNLPTIASSGNIFWLIFVPWWLIFQFGHLRAFRNKKIEVGFSYQFWYQPYPKRNLAITSSLGNTFEWILRPGWLIFHSEQLCTIRNKKISWIFIACFSTCIPERNLAITASSCNIFEWFLHPGRPIGFRMEPHMGLSGVRLSSGALVYKPNEVCHFCLGKLLV